MKATTGPISADYKVPGGKLLRVTLELDESTDPAKIASISLNGDFFMHPEEAIEGLESRLVNEPWETEALQDTLQTFFDTDVEIIGADVESIVHVILAAR
jgi:lipoate---protein ligase